jgi:hypothetical protein
MAVSTSATELAQPLQGRVDALGALSKSLLATLVVRGPLNKEDVPALVETARGLLPDDAGPGAAHDEFSSIAAEAPARLRIAANPRVVAHFDDH